VRYNLLVVVADRLCESLQVDAVLDAVRAPAVAPELVVSFD
jgi:hypothetical protein